MKRRAAFVAACLLGVVLGTVAADWPIDATRTTQLPSGVATGDLITGQGAPAAWARLAVGANGAFVMSDGAGVVYSTTTWPNAAAQGDVLMATAANTVGVLADSAVAGAPLVAGGAGADPSYDATPNFPAIGLTQSGESVEWHSGSVDPSAGAGVAAPAGSFYSRDAAGADGGELWFKTGDADTAWTQVTIP